MWTKRRFEICTTKAQYRLNPTTNQQATVLPHPISMLLNWPQTKLEIRTHTDSIEDPVATRRCSSECFPTFQTKEYRSINTDWFEATESWACWWSAGQMFDSTLSLLLPTELVRFKKKKRLERQDLSNWVKSFSKFSSAKNLDELETHRVIFTPPWYFMTTEIELFRCFLDFHQQMIKTN